MGLPLDGIWQIWQKRHANQSRWRFAPHTLGTLQAPGLTAGRRPFEVGQMSITDAISRLRMETDLLGVSPPIVALSFEGLSKVSRAIESEIGHELYGSAWLNGFQFDGVKFYLAKPPADLVSENITEAALCTAPQ